MVSIKKENQYAHFDINAVKYDSDIKIENQFVPEFTSRPNLSPDDIYVSAGGTPLMTPPNPMTRMDYPDDNLRVNGGGGVILSSRTRQLIFPASISQTDNFALPESLNELIGQQSIKRQLVDGIESNDLRSYLTNGNSSNFGDKLSQTLAANPQISQVQHQLPGDFVLYTADSIGDSSRGTRGSNPADLMKKTSIVRPPSPPIESKISDHVVGHKYSTKRISRHRTDAEKALWKRVRNTEAARRSRARKAEKLSQLEESCRRLQNRNERLEMEISHLRMALASQIPAGDDKEMKG